MLQRWELYSSVKLAAGRYLYIYSIELPPEMGSVGVMYVLMVLMRRNETQIREGGISDEALG